MAWTGALISAVKLAGYPRSESSGDWIKVQLGTCKKWCSQGSIFGPVLINISINELHEGAEYVVNRFA